MIGVPITVVPPTDDRRLVPFYRQKVLTLRSASTSALVHSVTIDGDLMLGFDDQRILSMVELTLPMTRWAGKSRIAQPIGQPGNIHLATDLSRTMEFDMPVTVSKDVQEELATVSIGEGAFNRVVALSDNAAALLLDGYLTGLRFSLAREGSAAG